ncbi:MAG: TlpA family protein disulfide reductase [Saprospiraceae bacterium]|nr:TlpA family protein disulfide reductase [Saprospiraceae bacterium]
MAKSYQTLRIRVIESPVNSIGSRQIKGYPCLPLGVMILLFLLSGFSPIRSQVEDTFRGTIAVKSYDLIHQPTKGRMARVLAKMNELPVSEFDTVYWTHTICNDTIVTELTTIHGHYYAKNIEFGKFRYIFDTLFYVYLKVPKSNGMFQRTKISDWRKHRKVKTRGEIPYNYSLVRPTDKKMMFFANVDPTQAFPRQAELGGFFGNVLHPAGLFEQLVFQDGYTDVLYDFQYTADTKLSCQEFFQDFFVKDISQEAQELFSYGVNVEIIPKEDRREFQVESADDTRKYSNPNWANLMGKYVYVDLWASWCGPCRIEMPYIARLRKKYLEEQLAILSISLDNKEDRDKWLKAIEDLQMDWPNWIVYGGFESNFAREYNITAIPRYLLIDPKGRIANANAPRPSDERLEELLNKIIE